MMYLHLFLTLTSIDCMVSTDVFNIIAVISRRPGASIYTLVKIHFTSDLQKHVRKVVGGFGKKSCVSNCGRKPGNTYASPTAMI